MTAENPADIKVNAKVSANFDPLLKATPKGCGRVFSLLFGKREADIARYKMLMTAQTEKEYQQIVSGGCDFIDGQIVPLPQSTLIDVLNPLQIEERQAIENLAGNIQAAVDALRETPDEEISDKEVDNDFFARWRREAKNIGNGELQRLWGRLLAEEIARPESISLRTLDVIKNISYKEADCFRKMCSCVIGGKHLVTTHGFYSVPGALSLDDLLVLNSVGLTVFPDQNTYMKWPARVESDGILRAFIGLKNTILILDTTSETLSIPGVSLTNVGREIYKICDCAAPVPDECDFIINAIQGRNDSAIISAVALKSQVVDGSIVESPLLWQYKR